MSFPVVPLWCPSIFPTQLLLSALVSSGAATNSSPSIYPITTIGESVFYRCYSLESKCGNCDNASVLSYFSWEIAIQKRATYLLCLKTRNQQYEGVHIHRPPNGSESRAFIKNEDGTSTAGELNTGMAFAILIDDVWRVILKFIGPNW